jgi:hydrogenase nickel incorporation protein HypA/HybF
MRHRRKRCRENFKRLILKNNMHELSVCQAMLDQVERLALEHGALYAEAIDVEIGTLSGIDPILLANAFLVMREGTRASSAILNALAVQTCVLCIQCGARTHTLPNRLVCGTCSGFRVLVIEGAELRLRNVKLCLSK